MRRMEILRIRREHINSQQRTIFIPKAKGGSRLQPITQHLAEFLEGYLAALPQGSEGYFLRLQLKKVIQWIFANLSGVLLVPQA